MDVLGVVALPARAVPLLTLVLAIWATGRFVVRDAPRFGLARVEVANLTTGVAFFGLATARIVAIAPHWRIMLAYPVDILRLTDGLSLAGGVAGALVGLSILARRGGVPLAAVADLLGSALPFGIAVYSAGCVGRGDCFGRVAQPPLGIVFPGLRTARYPVELYAAAGALFIAGGLQLVRRRALPAGGQGALSVGAVAAMWVGLDGLRLSAGGGGATMERVAPALVAVGAVIVLIKLIADGTGSGSVNRVGARVGERTT